MVKSVIPTVLNGPCKCFPLLRIRVRKEGAPEDLASSKEVGIWKIISSVEDPPMQIITGKADILKQHHVTKEKFFKTCF